ncbi:hypothetical protein M899_1413 [Bacteriovorax sp. BSW11_IV]|uniref:hypothetical protein n=1 Tax=Bacteriovorax sp. BSW11_IV TaxID=1353529 RepID=UPI00038A55AC|nr:hypothetical protein [Bacteriovorax sp. BSW11_IV]EQC45761.1 hypothetical protein M899_1413 [Bacteriovorax sp. BSW11_IV]
MRNIINKSSIYYLLITLLTILIFKIAVIQDFSISDPAFDIYFDAMNIHVAIKMFHDGLWWWDNLTRVSFPYGAPMGGFPVSGGQLDYFFIWIFSLISKNVFLVANLYLLFTVVLTALLTYYSCLELRFNKTYSIIIAILYSFIPHMYFRNTAHIMLTYYLFPVVLMYSIKFLTNEFGNLSKFKKNIFYLVMLLAGLQYTYNGVFILYVLFAVGVIKIIEKKREHFKPLIVGTVVLVISTIINIAPVVKSYKSNSELNQKMTTFKKANMIDDYPLNLRDMLIPVQDNHFFVLKGIRYVFDRAEYKYNGELRSSSLGLIGCLGLIICIVTLVFNTKLKSLRYSKEISQLFMFLFLLAMPGGLASFINLVSPQIRCYNRVAPMISFLAICSFFVFLEMKLINVSKIKKNVILFALFLFGLIDQNPGFTNLYSKGQRGSGRLEDIANLGPLLNEVESKFPMANNVFYLPFNIYPSSPRVNKMPAQADGLAYLLSDRLNWSIMPLLPSAEEELSKVKKLTGNELLCFLSKLSYDSVLIDRRGYSDNGNEILNSIKENYVHENLLESSNKNYVFIKFLATECES